MFIKLLISISIFASDIDSHNVLLQKCDSGDSFEILNKIAASYIHNDITTITGNRKGIADALGNIAVIYKAWGEYEKALNHLQISLDILQMLNDKNGIAGAYNNIGSIYKNRGNYSKAQIYYMKALNIYEKNQNFAGSASTLNKIGILYKELRLLIKDKALKESELYKQRFIRNSLFAGTILLLLLLLLLLLFLLYNRNRIKQKANLQLSIQKAQIQNQKEEIESHRDEILTKNKEIMKINKELKQQQTDLEKAFKKSAQQQLKLLIAFEKISSHQKEINESIQYAHKIQMAVMPPEDYLNSIIDNYFILFKPRDIVSGDFYWAREIIFSQGVTPSDALTKILVIAAADCTGHGVPGAFMSMLGISYLNEIANTLVSQGVTQSQGAIQSATQSHALTNNDCLLASEILNRLRDKIISTLHQSGKAEEADDGMDIALCIFEPSTLKLQFAGAHNPLYLILSDAEHRYVFEEIKGDNMPISKLFSMRPKPFTDHNLQLSKNDRFYIFSDGYANQFGGPEGKKFKYQQLKQLLISSAHLTMKEQKDILDKAIEDWIGYKDQYTGQVYNQLDDILIIGVKV
ncbi:MAG: SpoIIE family protein phosphatase [Bacteroidia bacterium]|nr:SpoIIE family protein phosphatase [Bacteroidia bacterium]